MINIDKGFEERAHTAQVQKMEQLRQVSKRQQNFTNMPADHQKILHEFYISFMSKLLFGNCNIKESEVRRIIGKLPEIIKEWTYLEQIQKSQGFNFEDKNVANFSFPNNTLRLFSENLNTIVESFNKEVSKLGVPLTQRNVQLGDSQFQMKVTMPGAPQNRSRGNSASLARKKSLENSQTLRQQKLLKGTYLERKPSKSPVEIKVQSENLKRPETGQERKKLANRSSRMYEYKNQALDQLFENDLLSLPAAPTPPQPPAPAAVIKTDFNQMDADHFFARYPVVAHIDEAGESLKNNVLMSVYSTFTLEQNSKFNQLYNFDQNESQIEFDVTALDKFLALQEVTIDSKLKEGQNDSITQSTDHKNQIEVKSQEQTQDLRKPKSPKKNNQTQRRKIKNSNF